jgi:hypothetical protein
MKGRKRGKVTERNKQDTKRKYKGTRKHGKKKSNERDKTDSADSRPSECHTQEPKPGPLHIDFYSSILRRFLPSVSSRSVSNLGPVGSLSLITLFPEQGSAVNLGPDAASWSGLVIRIGKVTATIFEQSAYSVRAPSTQ